MKSAYWANHPFHPRHIWWKDGIEPETLLDIERLILDDKE